MNIAANVKPQIAPLAKRDLAKASVRKDGGAPQASEKDLFSNLVDNKDKKPAVSKSSSESLPKSSSPTEKISTSGEPRLKNDVEPKQVKANAKPDVKESSEKTSEAVNREKAMQVFLDQMQAQLGVEPEQIVDAFSKLELSDLALPPEETIPKVLGELNLNEKDKEVAGGLYAEMLAMSATASMSKYLVDQNQTAQVEVLNPTEASLREVNKNISAMSNDFFANGRPEASSSATTRAKAGQAYGMQSGRSTIPAVSPEAQAGANINATELSEASGKLELPANFSSTTLQDNIPLVMPTMAQADMATLTPESIAQNPMPAIEALEKELATLEQLSPNDPDLPMMKQALAQLKESIPQQMTAPQAPKVDLSAMKAKAGVNAYGNSAQPAAMMGAAKNASDMSGGESSDDSDSKKDASQLDGLGQTGPQKNAVLDNKQFVINAPKATTADIQANVKEIMNQAQFLAKKGGGEMKVRLSPEGMGDVHLKVTSNNGQLNIEMVANNDDAKKLLEKGIGELKANLAEHKLHIEHIKIDSPKETSNQMSQQFDQADQQFQQRFLQDFRDQNSGFRREFFDIGPARTPGSNREEASNTVAPTKRPAARRLDLVA